MHSIIHVTAIVGGLLLQTGSSHEATLTPTIGLDLETGQTDGVNYHPNMAYDLVFSCGSQGEEFLRALRDTSWAYSSNNDFGVGLDVLRAARYAAPTHASGYPEIFHTWRNAVPVVGTVYFIRTTEGNLAKVRLAGYVAPDPSPYVCRNLKIEYVLYRVTPRGAPVPPTTGAPPAQPTKPPFDHVSPEEAP